MGEGKVHHNGCESPDPVWPAQEHWHAYQPWPEAGILLVSRVHKVPQWETENLGHLHGQEVIAGGSRASVRQLDALLDLPTPYIDTCLFPGLPFGLWFTIIHGSRITGKPGSEATCSSGGSPAGSGFTSTSDIPETSFDQGCQLPMHKCLIHVLFNPACGFLGISPLKTKTKQTKQNNESTYHGLT